MVATLDRLPTEILHRICDFLEDTEEARHLLNLRLTCKSLAVDVAPRIFQGLSLNYDRASFQALVGVAKHEVLRHYVKFISYCPQVPQYIPQELFRQYLDFIPAEIPQRYAEYTARMDEINDIRLDFLDFQALNYALKRFPNLHSFRCSETSSWSSMATELRQWGGPDTEAEHMSLSLFLSTLAAAEPALTELTMAHISLKFLSITPGFTCYTAALGASLTSLSITTHGLLGGHPASGVELYLHSVLKRTPNLEKLCLMFMGHSDPPRLAWQHMRCRGKQVRWPKLRSFILLGVKIERETFESFIADHEATLESAELTDVILIDSNWVEVWESLLNSKIPVLQFRNMLSEGQYLPGDHPDKDTPITLRSVNMQELPRSLGYDANFRGIDSLLDISRHFRVHPEGYSLLGLPLPQEDENLAENQDMVENDDNVNIVDGHLPQQN